MKGERIGNGVGENVASDWDSLMDMRASVDLPSVGDLPSTDGRKMKSRIDHSDIDERRTIRRKKKKKNDGTFEYMESDVDVSKLEPEKLGEYFEMRHARNVEMLSEKAPHLVDTYKDLIEENPMLACVGLRDERITDRQGKEFGNASFYSHFRNKDGMFVPVVKFNFSNYKIYGGEKKSENEEITAKLQAGMLGVRESDFVKNAEVFSTFVFLHEMGHAYDFFYRYLAPKGGWGMKQDELKKRLPGAIGRSKVDYSEGKCGRVVPLHIDHGESRIDAEAWRDFLKARGRQRGMKGMDIQRVSSREYRQVMAEARADRFAADFMQRHWQRYLCADGKKEAGKLEAGGWYDVDKDNFQILTGLMEGAKVNCVEYGRDEKKRPVERRRVTGYLAVTPMEGGRLAIADRPDPASWKPLMNEEDLHIDAVKRKLWKRSDGRLENAVYVSGKDGREFMFSFAEKKAGEDIIEESVESMNKRLGFRVGSRLQIVKVGMEDRDASDVKSGSILGGRLSQEIEEGHGVHFDNGAYSSRVEKVYRKWKTFYVETASGGTYEVVPVDAYK